MKKSIAYIFALIFLNPFTYAATSDFKQVEFETDRSLPIIYLSVLINAGAVHDEQEKLGLASIASKMLLRGTQKHSKIDFFNELDKLGGTIGVDVRNEGIVFRAAVLSENLEKFLELFEETIVKPKFTAEELIKLKKETIGQILEQKSNDRYLVGYHFNRFFYGNHPYGNPILGTEVSLKNITTKDIIDFYNDYFGSKSITLFGSGDSNSEVIEKWFASVLMKLNALHPEAKSAPIISKPVISSGRRAILINKPNSTQTQILIGGIGIRPEDSGFYAVQLANQSFGGGTFQSTLMQEIRVKRGWTYGINNAFRFGIQPRHFAIHLFPKNADAVPAIELTLKLFENWVKNGITKEDFDYAKQSLVNNSPFNYDTAKKRLENSTQEFLYNFKKGYYKDWSDEINKVSSSDIVPALLETFKPENLTLVVVGDASKLKTSIEKVPGIGKVQVKNYLEE